MLGKTISRAVIAAATTATLMACGGAEPDEMDRETDAEINEEASVGETTQALTATVYPAPFLDTSTMRDNGADWDPGRGKATCAPGETISGLSDLPGGPARTALCKQIGASTFSGNVVEALTVDAGESVRRAPRWGDWDPGALKLECGNGQYIRAVSENTSYSHGNNRFHAAQCATGTGLTSTCTPRLFENGDNRGTTATGDWDNGTSKGECGTHEYLAGVGVDPASGRPRSLLCCTALTQATATGGQAVYGHWTSSGGQDPQSASNRVFLFDNPGPAISVVFELHASADSFLYLLDAGGDVLASDNNGAGGLDARITTELPAGSYKLVAATASAGQSAEFTLRTSRLSLRYPQSLEVKAATTFDWVYDDRGTGASADVSVWRPKLSDYPGYYSLGDVAMSGHNVPPGTTFVVKGEDDLLAPPVGYAWVWADWGSGGTFDASIWTPVPPPGYTCLGTVAVLGYNPPPTDLVRCVKTAYVLPANAVWVWQDSGSGANARSPGRPPASACSMTAPRRSAQGRSRTHRTGPSSERPPRPARADVSCSLLLRSPAVATRIAALQSHVLPRLLEQVHELANIFFQLLRARRLGEPTCRSRITIARSGRRVLIEGLELLAPRMPLRQGGCHLPEVVPRAKRYAGNGEDRPGDLLRGLLAEVGCLPPPRVRERPRRHDLLLGELQERRRPLTRS